VLPRMSRAEADALTAVLERALDDLADTPGTTICRLCDMRRCREGLDCPVVARQVALGVPPPGFVPVE
jgi:hypothetical protein